uniref:Methyltransferase FkbM domain-containing protein n=1 Tax=Coccolithus braarudii TaxID=221442 RepID=A0A7S0Q5V8_9EUKA|mmetsp:Transcript_45618/g.97158  ORF Transcript_45618/g.97158 Transcript_45618/m.97158 type:complete len:542 (+) Transcript_45618:28-1653(+)
MKYAMLRLAGVMLTLYLCVRISALADFVDALSAPVPLSKPHLSAHQNSLPLPLTPPPSPALSRALPSQLPPHALPPPFGMKRFPDRMQPICSQGGSPPTTVSNPMENTTRWHVTTQELLFRHLRAIWDDDRPRAMVDLGGSAGHGFYLNISDAMLWTAQFNHSGSQVVALDAFYDYALDMQQRFEALQPRVPNVSLTSLHGAIGKPSGRSSHVNLDQTGAFTHFYCSRTERRDRITILEARGITDHSCRITRQRAGLSLSRLPLPQSPYPFAALPPAREDAGVARGAEYRVPMLELPRIWLETLGGRHLDLLKVDIDLGFQEFSEHLLPLVRARAFSVMVMETDDMDSPAWLRIEELSCMLWEHEYALFLKVPCAGAKIWSQRAAYLPISGRYHAQLPAEMGGPKSRGFRRLACNLGGDPQCWVQDVLALDLRRPELRELVRLGNEECGVDYPMDVHPSWSTPQPAHTVRISVPPGGLVTEEGFPSGLWPPLVKVLTARCLPDGTWSCGRTASASRDNSAAAPPSCKLHANETVSCQELWD